MSDTNEVKSLMTSSRAAILTVVLVLVLSFVIMPKRGFWINDNGCKFMQVESIIESGFKDFSIQYPGKEHDPGYEFNPLPAPFGRLENGKLYANYSPVFAVVSALPYKLFGFTGLYLLPLVSALFCLGAVWVLAGMMQGPGQKRPLSVLVAALCTPIWFYSVTFWEHMPAVCLVLWAVVGTLSYVRTGSWRGLSASALLCALSVYFRDDLYLVCLILLAVVAVRRGGSWKMPVLYALVLLLALVPLWIFQWKTIGNPLGFHITSVSVAGDGVAAYVSGRFRVLGLMFGAHGSPWVSVAANIPFVLMFVIYPALTERVFRKSVLMLSVIGLVQGLILFLGHLSADSPVWWLRKTNGLFSVSPILLLAFVRKREVGASAAAARRTTPGFLLWIIMMVHVVLYVGLSPSDSGGIHWGNRYLLHLYPMMAVLAGTTIAAWLDSPGQRIRSGAAALSAAVAISITFQLYSVRLLYKRKAFSEWVNDEVQERTEKAVIARGSFVPQELARAYGSKMVFLASRGEEGVMRLAGILGASGERRALVVRQYMGNDESVPNLLNDGLNFTCLQIDSMDLDVVDLERHNRNQGRREPRINTD